MQVRVDTLRCLLWKRGLDPKCTWWLCKASLPLLATGKAETQITHTHLPAKPPPSILFLATENQALLTCGSLSLPLPLPGLCTSGCCFSCCKRSEPSAAEMLFLWAALSEIPQINTGSFMSLSEFDCSPNTGKALGLSSSSGWDSGKRNNRPEPDNRSHQSTPGDGNPTLWSSTSAYNDTVQSGRSSVSCWP